LVNAVGFRLMSASTACLAVAVALAACGSSPSSPGGGSASPKAGGSLTVLEATGYSGDWPYGLDPATNVDGAADQDYMNAIYGQLFELGPKGAVIDDLAAGYRFSDGGKAVTIDIRQGVKFADGTPFDAQSVRWNFQRDIHANCTCKPTVPITSVTAPGKDTIKVTLATPDGAFVDQMFDSILNWIASPTAYARDGEKKFAQFPVGAGPFTVVSDTYSNELVLKRNPGYWQAGRPYLDTLTFKTVASDEAGYEALLSGAGQVYVDMSTTQLLVQAAKQSSLRVENQLGTSSYDLQLNTKVAPFNSVRAREAIYAATDFGPILTHIFGNLYPAVQGFTGPGGLCYQQHVPGYQGYDLALAKQLIQQTGLNKVTINLGTIQNLVAQETTEALQQEWQAAGLRVTIHNYPLAGLIQAFAGSWQAMIQTAGSYDPAAGVGVGFRFMSTSPFSGVHDPRVDSMLTAAEASTNLSARCQIYGALAEYIAKNYYGPFYFSFAPANVAVTGVGGPGLTEPLPTVVVTPTILWEDVYNSQ
jgi:peptide/nickel transport system substrate-binding protein